MSRSIMEDFTGIKKEWDRIKGEKKDGEDQIDRANPPTPEPNTDAENNYDYGCCYVDNPLVNFESLDQNVILLQEYVDKINNDNTKTPIEIGDYFTFRVDSSVFTTWCYEGNLKFTRIKNIVNHNLIVRGQRYVHNPSR